ncbi:MAG: cyclase family protein [Alphaproteobacteria bacterium]
MQITLTFGKARYSVDYSAPLDISVPVRFEGERLSSFGAPPAKRQPYEASGFIGNVARGGSCNCDSYAFIPHTSGTHTECVGHILDTPVFVNDILKDALIPATLVTVTPVTPKACNETYSCDLRPNDRVISATALHAAIRNHAPTFLTALIIRTLPNGAEKTSRDYNATGAPFFSTEAMRLICSLNVKHLLVDIPSIDRMDDEGKLSNHRLFWDVPPEVHTATGKPHSQKTITELIYAPETIADGRYLLNLQAAAFEADATPSRPVLFGITPL